MNASVEPEQLAEIIDTFVDSVRGELQARWEAWPIDLTKSFVFEAIGGLLARQVTLASQLARAPQIWNGHVAPLILRAMTDVYITLAWILKDPDARSDRYIKYGLGQRKLWLEHFKASLAEKGESDIENHPMVKAAVERLNSERFEHLTEVNVGSWAEQSTREMAEEGGCLDLYRLAFTPFSSAVHSMWHHVADYNLERCRNPLHQYHRVPVDPDLGADIDYLYRAAKYVAKSFALFDEYSGVSLETPSAFDALAASLIKLGMSEEESGLTGDPD